MAVILSYVFVFVLALINLFLIWLNLRRHTQLVLLLLVMKQTMFEAFANQHMPYWAPWAEATGHMFRIQLIQREGE